MILRRPSSYATQDPPRRSCARRGSDPAARSTDTSSQVDGKAAPCRQTALRQAGSHENPLDAPSPTSSVERLPPAACDVPAGGSTLQTGAGARRPRGKSAATWGAESPLAALARQTPVARTRCGVLARFQQLALDEFGPATSIRGAWCSGITSASHAEGPGLNPQRVHGCDALYPAS